MQSRWIGRNGQWEARSTDGILSFGGGPLSVTVKTPVAAHSTRIDGQAVALDTPGGKVEGAITLDLPNLSLRAERGELQAFGDSISIWLP